MATKSTKKTTKRTSKPVLPKLTRDQARAVKDAAEKLTKADKVYSQGQEIAGRTKAKPVIVLTPEEQMARHWAVYDGVINGAIAARTGLALLEHGPLGQLRLVEARERDNGKRRKTRLKTK